MKRNNDYRLPYTRPVKAPAMRPPTRVYKPTPAMDALNLDSLSPQAKAFLNEEAVLMAINHFGHIRLAELLAYVWPERTPQQAMSVATKVIERLLYAQQIQERLNALGTTSYVITSRGASRLHTLPDIKYAKTGANLATTGPTFFHRTIGTAYLVNRYAQEPCEVYGEHLLMRDQPISRQYLNERFSKMPDGLVFYPDPEGHGYLVDWIEVEYVTKNYEKTAHVLNLLLKDPWIQRDGTYAKLARIIFIVDQLSHHESRISTHFLRFLNAPEAKNLDPLLALNRLWIARAQVEAPCTWKGYLHVQGPNFRTSSKKPLGDVVPRVFAPDLTKPLPSL